MNIKTKCDLPCSSPAPRTSIVVVRPTIVDVVDVSAAVAAPPPAAAVSAAEAVGAASCLS